MTKHPPEAGTHPSGCRNSKFFQFSRTPRLLNTGISMADDQTSARNPEFKIFIVSWLFHHGQFNGGYQKSPESRNSVIHASRAFRLRHPQAMLYGRILYHASELFNLPEKSKHQPGERGRNPSQAKARSAELAGFQSAEPLNLIHAQIFF